MRLGIIGPDEEALKQLVGGTRIPYISFGNLDYGSGGETQEVMPNLLKAGITSHQRGQVSVKGIVLSPFQQQYLNEY